MATQSSELILINSSKLEFCNLTQPLDFFSRAARDLSFVVPLHRLHSVGIHRVIRVKGWRFLRHLFSCSALVNGRRRIACFDKLDINHSLVKRVGQKLEPSHLMLWQSRSFRLLGLSNGLKRLPQQRLACFDHSNKRALHSYGAPTR